VQVHGIPPLSNAERGVRSAESCAANHATRLLILRSAFPVPHLDAPVAQRAERPPYTREAPDGCRVGGSNPSWGTQPTRRDSSPAGECIAPFETSNPKLEPFLCPRARSRSSGPVNVAGCEPVEETGRGRLFETRIPRIVTNAKRSPCEFVQFVSFGAEATADRHPAFNRTW
jgi:hypothetical protein